MNNYKISSLSFTLMFICIINALLPGILFPYMIYEAKTSLFISILISYFLGLLIIYFFFKVFNFLPDESIFGKLNRVSYKPDMEVEKREQKYAGWKKAVASVITNK